MKAILEMELPKNCEDCKASQYITYCGLRCNFVEKCVEDYRAERHPDCPLKIVDDKKMLQNKCCFDCENSLSCSAVCNNLINQRKDGGNWRCASEYRCNNNCHFYKGEKQGVNNA